MKNFSTRLKELVYDEEAVEEFQELFQEDALYVWDAAMDWFLDTLVSKETILKPIEELFEEENIARLIVIGFGIVELYYEYDGSVCNK